MSKSKINRRAKRQSAGKRKREDSENPRLLRAAVAPNRQGGTTREGSKLAKVVAMLRKPDGTTIDAMAKATGWQPHSVRGALSGTIKKKLGLLVMSEKTDGARVYRVTN